MVEAVVHQHRDLPLDPLDPIFDTVFPDTLPPLEAYRYIPPQKEIRSRAQRFMFHGGVKFDEDEEKVYSEFLDYLKHNPELIEEVPEDKREYMRTLHGVNFKLHEAALSLTDHYRWTTENIPKSLTPVAIKLLNHGYITVFGRDIKFRPAIIINAAIQRVLQRGGNQLDVEAMMTCVIFTQEYVIKNMFLPGEVENWVVIVDMQGMGATDLPREELKRIGQILGAHYRARMGKCWVLNSSFGTKAVWNIVKLFIAKETSQKIHLTNRSTDQDLQQHFHPSQLLKKYGGEAEEPDTYWPPVVPSGPIVKDPETLVDEGAYQAILLQNPDLKRPPVEDDDEFNMSIPSLGDDAQTNSVPKIINFAANKNSRFNPDKNSVETQESILKQIKSQTPRFDVGEQIVKNSPILVVDTPSKVTNEKYFQSSPEEVQIETPKNMKHSSYANSGANNGMDAVSFKDIQLENQDQPFRKVDSMIIENEQNKGGAVAGKKGIQVNNKKPPSESKSCCSCLIF